MDINKKKTVLNTYDKIASHVVMTCAKETFKKFKGCLPFFST